jgi:hypothetical protein
LTTIDVFRTRLLDVLPQCILSSLSQKRASLLPATDMVAMLSDAVLLFSHIDESIRRISRIPDVEVNVQPAVNTIIKLTDDRALWITKLEAITDILGDYITILTWLVMTIDLNMATLALTEIASLTAKQKKRPGGSMARSTNLLPPISSYLSIRR